MGIGGVDWEIGKVYLQGCRAEDGGRPEELRSIFDHLPDLLL